MRNFFIILKVQFQSIMAGGRRGKKNTETSFGSLFGRYLLSLLPFVIVSAYFTYINYKNVSDGGATLDLLPKNAFLIYLGLTVVYGFYDLVASLFGVRDYDFLSSLPVKRGVVVGARIVAFYLSNIILGILLILPSTVLYGVKSSPDPWFYIASFLNVFVIPVFPMVFSTLLAIAMKVLYAKRVHGKTYEVLTLIAILVGFLAVISVREGGLLRAFGSLSNSDIVGIYFSSLNDPMQFLFVLGISVLSGTLFCVFVFCLYDRIHFRISSVATKGNYRIGNKSYKRVSVLGALVKKEIKRVFSDTYFTINVITGPIVMILFTVVFCLIVAPSRDSGIGRLLSLLFIPICGMTTSVAIVTEGSVSLEGHSIWIPKTLPVKTRTVLFSKIAASCLFSVPIAACCSIVFPIVCKCTFLELLCAFFGVVLFTLGSAFWGQILNCRFVNLDWITPAQTIKNSVPAFIMTAIGLGLGIGGVILIFVFAAKFGNVMNSLTLYGILAAIYTLYFLIGFIIWNKVSVRRFEEI